MKVSEISKSLKATPVGGIIAAIDPKPRDYVGQRIDIEDINCKDAVFSSVDDSCSAYFKLSYNQDNTNESIVFPVKIAPNNIEIPTILSFQVVAKPTWSISNYRMVLEEEAKYYSGSAVASNKNNYKIILIQNGSLKPLNIVKINGLSNPVFYLLHRANDSDNDLFYNNFNECSLVNNSELKQTNHLDKLNDSCILIYSVNKISREPEQTDVINIDTDATYVFPRHIKKFNLIANFKANQIPLQEVYGAQMTPNIANSAHISGTDMVMDSWSPLHSEVINVSNKFSKVSIKSFFDPVRLQILTASSSQIEVPFDNTEEGTIYPGTQIVTDLTNYPITIGKVERTYNPNVTPSLRQVLSEFSPGFPSTPNILALAGQHLCAEVSRLICIDSPSYYYNSNNGNFVITGVFDNGRDDNRNMGLSIALHAREVLHSSLISFENSYYDLSSFVLKVVHDE